MNEAIERDPVPPRLWGRDHYSTLLYIESVVVNADGIPNRDRMRTDASRHPAMDGPSMRMLPRELRDKKYPTRLAGGVQLDDHDDWDCARDLEAAGLLRWEGTGINPCFVFTDLGWQIANMLRRHRAEGGTNDNFDLLRTVREHAASATDLLDALGLEAAS